MRTRLLIAMTFSGIVTLAHAFEPGHDRVCTPSADGQTFECRDKVTGAVENPQAKPVKPARTVDVHSAAPAAPKPPSETVTAAAAPRPAANKLPNYLMQNPSTAEPERDVEPATAVARRPTNVELPASVDQSGKAPAASDSSLAKAQAPPIKPAEASQARGAEGVAVVQPSATEPVPGSHASAATSAPVRNVTRTVPETKPLAASTTAPPAEITSLPGASAFLALPASHYTLVLASVRDPIALEGLTKALDAQAAQLYLLKLNMPDGDWYSLCWSDFADLDVARAARADLPADAPIRSGWPRQIGLLQKEIAR